MTDLLLLACASALVFVLAALAQAITGFGSALVAVPLLAVLVEPSEAVVAATTVSLALTGGAAWRERPHVERRAGGVLTLAGALGMPLGLWVMTVADERSLRAGIAVTMLVLVALVASGLRVGRHGMVGAGLVSGALLTSTGMNGPPLVMALLDRDPRSYRATLQAVFAGQDLVAVTAFAALGHMSATALALTVGGVAGLPLGWRIGDRIFQRITAARLRPLVLALLVATAASMLLTALS